ncbi:helix-turn-helix domain-containing protein [Parageobacillus thermoglucosidasius]|uniref:helix-turn-helix domain-containing protein n=1 Tax=Parageobacillus thermoglucosidasius TaxID=1426 RepID=UPI000B56F117|nr:helix-turn-helix transcriptional regulator [Parageobacillus thermoglucosidasius]MBY6268868.1 hypothetical protein [Parageobacillus thermoglucosidasius]OUM89255.1 MAG: hypothetical protein BAA00_13555 [Parageobacillus thermoglucosidasius]
MSRDKQIGENFAALMRHYRAKRELTLAELSEMTGISISYLSRIEKAERLCISIQVMTQIVKALNIPNDQVLEVLGLKDGETYEGARKTSEYITI